MMVVAMMFCCDDVFYFTYSEQDYTSPIFFLFAQVSYCFSHHLTPKYEKKDTFFPKSNIIASYLVCTSHTHAIRDMETLRN